MNLSRPEAEQQFLEVHVDNQVSHSYQNGRGKGGGNILDQIFFF